VSRRSNQPGLYDKQFHRDIAAAAAAGEFRELHEAAGWLAGAAAKTAKWKEQ